MKYTVKNKAISLNGGSIVYNEKDEIVFKVSGNFIKNIFGLHTKKIKDKDGKKLFVVRNKFWHKPFFRSAIIYANGKKIATVTNSHLIKNGYEVIGATEPITVEGTGWNLDIKLGNKIIGKIEPSKEINFNNTYVFEAKDQQDVPFLVAMLIAIDNIHDAHRNR